MKRNGDCYKIHAEALLDINTTTLDLAEALLCHGSVWHSESERHGHCWLELNKDIVLDISNGHKVIMRREVYYALGKVEDVTQYDAKQLRELVLKHGTYGPF